MTNIEALYNDCQTILNTFYPSEGVLIRALETAGLDPNAENETNLEFSRIGLRLCGGFVSTLQIEGDVHNNTNREDARRSVWWWARHYGFDPYDFIEPPSSIQDISYMY